MDEEEIFCPILLWRCGRTLHVRADAGERIFRFKNPVLNIGPSFEEYMAGNKETKTKNIDEVNISELRSDFESDVAELLERLPCKPQKQKYLDK